MSGSNYLSQCGYTVHSNLAACAGKSPLTMSGHALGVETGDPHTHASVLHRVCLYMSYHIQIVATFD